MLARVLWLALVLPALAGAERDHESQLDQVVLILVSIA